MKSQIAQINLVLAWLGILLGFISGTVLGLFFHREDWLGGYGSFQRRMYRLGHISLFGLAIVNFMFYLTAQSITLDPNMISVASWAFILGAGSMPLCCLLMAHFPRTRLLFGIPILSLLIGGAVMVLTLSSPSKQSQPITSHQPHITDHRSPITN